MHYVFDNKAEFEEYALHKWGAVPTITPWREGRFGDWMEADDGGIVQAIYWKELPHHGDRKNYKTHRGYVRTIVGTFIQNDKFSMDTDFEKHPNRYRFGSSTDAEYLERRRNREELSNPEVVFAAQLCAGKTIQQAYEEAFGSTHDWYRRALFLLKRERVMSKIKENVKDKLDSKFGGDVLDFIFDELKKLIIATENDNVKLSALRDLGDWSGEKEKVKQVTSGQVAVFEPFQGNELAKIEAEEVKVISESTSDV
jgi:hypothetical protein